jgi:hypothetical protein
MMGLLWQKIKIRPPVSESALGDRVLRSKPRSYLLILLKNPMPTNPIPDVGWRLTLFSKVWVAGLEFIGRYYINFIYYVNAIPSPKKGK